MEELSSRGYPQQLSVVQPTVDTQSSSLDVDVPPTDAHTFYAFYTREDIFDFQLSRQSGGAVTFNPASNWSSTFEDKVNSFGAGAVFTPNSGNYQAWVGWLNLTYNFTL